MVFDVMAAWQGWIFKLDPHIERFYRSTHAVRIEMPYTQEEFRSLFIETYRRSGLKDAFIECIATRGDYSPGPVLRLEAQRYHFLGAVSLERSAGEDRGRREGDVCPYPERAVSATSIRRSRTPTGCTATWPAWRDTTPASTRS